MFELSGQPVCRHHRHRHRRRRQPMSPVSRALYFTFIFVIFTHLQFFATLFLIFPFLLPSFFHAQFSRCGSLYFCCIFYVGMHCGWACDTLLNSCTQFPAQIFCDSLISLFVSIVFFLSLLFSPFLWPDMACDFDTQLLMLSISIHPYGSGVVQTFSG